MAVDLAKNFKFGDANLKVHNGVVDAGHPDFTGANNAEKVDAAIQFANTNNHPLCLVPESLIPYDPTAMPNGHLDAVRMVREGGGQDVYDLMAYGGDPSASDNAPAIKAWRDAVEQAGPDARGVAPVGTFDFAGPVQFTQGARQYFGMGRELTVFNNTGTSGEHGFEVTGGGAFMNDAEFRWMKVTGATGGGDGWHLTNQGRTLFDSVSASGNGRHGINVQNSFAPRFDDLKAEDNGTDGLRIEDGTDHKGQLATVNGAQLNRNGGWGAVYDMVENQIAGPWIDVTASENTSGGMKFDSIKAVKLYSPWCEDNSNVHIQLGDTGNCIGAIIEGAFFLQNDSALTQAIDAVSGKKLRIEASRFRDCTTALNVQSGFDFIEMGPNDYHGASVTNVASYRGDTFTVTDHADDKLHLGMPGTDGVKVEDAPIEEYFVGNAGSGLQIDVQNMGTGTGGTLLRVNRDGTEKLRFGEDGMPNFGGGSVPSRKTYTPTNVTTDRSYDADSTTTAELADVLGTLISDLQDAGFFD